MLVTDRLCEGYRTAVPSVSPLLHELGHLLDGTSMRQHGWQSPRGELPCMSVAQRHAWYQAKRHEVPALAGTSRRNHGAVWAPLRVSNRWGVFGRVLGALLALTATFTTARTRCIRSICRVCSVRCPTQPTRGLYRLPRRQSAVLRTGRTPLGESDALVGVRVTRESHVEADTLQRWHPDQYRRS